MFSTSMIEKRQYKTIYGAAGPACILCGVIIAAFWWYLYNGVVLKKLPLSSDSETFRMWASLEIPLHIKIYLFNWTNAEESATYGYKPELQEVGPYVYRVELYKKDFVWNDEDDTLTYTTGQRFFLVRELSVGDPNVDVVTIPDLITQIIKYKIRTVPDYGSATNIASGLYRSDAHVQGTVSTLLFEGYDHVMLKAVSEVKVKFTDTVDATITGMNSWKWSKWVFRTFTDRISDMLGAVNDKLGNIPNRFPGLIPMNGTRENTINIHTGKTDLSKFGLIRSCNFQRVDPTYNKSCGHVCDSSPGDLWPVDITKGDSASIFIPDFCSPLRLMKVGEQIVNGIDGIRFEGLEESFNYAAQDCPNGECPLESFGARDLSPCLGVPMVASFPHFYAADPAYLSTVNGLNPNKNLHAFHFTLQKDYGIVLHAAIRLQINLRLEETYLRPSVVFPMLWFEIDVELPAVMADKLYFGFVTVPLVFKTLGYSLCAFGVILMISAKYKLCQLAEEKSIPVAMLEKP